MYCFVILLLFNEMQVSVWRFSAILHLRILLADTEFAKQLLYCILYCIVGHCFPLLIGLSFCVYCFACKFCVSVYLK